MTRKKYDTRRTWSIYRCSKSSKLESLIDELEVGEKSGMVDNFDRSENLKNLHEIDILRKDIQDK